MVEQDAMPFFLSSGLPGNPPGLPAGPGLVHPAFTDVDLQTRSTERVLWQGHAAVAEFALSDGELAPPRWSLPETTEVTITDRRVAYAHIPPVSLTWPPDPVSGSGEVASGETRWLWPQHLRVQPGERTADSISEIHLVCGPSDGAWPTLVIAGGDVAEVRAADRVANLLRRAIVQFRLDNAGGLGLSTPQSRMLSRLLITPEFGNYPGGKGQTVPLPGAYPLLRAAAHGPAAHEPAAYADEVRYDRRPDVADDTRPIPVPQLRRDAGETVELASRASSVAARVAELVRTSALSAPQDGTVRLSATRFAANVGQHRGVARRPGPDPALGVNRQH